MKKKGTVLAVCMTALIGLTVFAGCGSEEYALSYYHGENKDESGDSVYNEQLFYSNTLQQGYPDPFVLDDTARSGYYYLYGTSGSFSIMRSKDLAVWEDVGPTLVPPIDGEIPRLLHADMWAPEVIYDDETELYYLFFSATAETDTTYTEGNGIVSGVSYCNLYVATSDSAEGPFEMVNFMDAASCGESALHDYNTTAGIELDENELSEYAWIRQGGVYYEAAFPHYFAKYCLFSPDELYKFNRKNGVSDETGLNGRGYFGNIDPSPFEDPETGEKYLYVKMEGTNGIMVVHMLDWLTPDWDNAEIVLMVNYYTVEDWRNNTNFGVSYESENCNEGPHILYYDGVYYLTFSANGYGSSNYRVATAVGDSPMGPFRKLTEEEGGLLLCSSTTESNSVSGAGHHSFAYVGDQLYIIYHRHRNYLIGGSDRYTAMDEVKWLTVKDINGNDLVVPYTNGPTDTLQPLPESVSGYKNIAAEAQVSCSNEEAEISCVTDGLFSVHKTADPTFMSYVRETYSSDTQTTFTFAFDSARTVRAVMVYNSASYRDIFLNISRIEFTLADGSTRVIRDLSFDVDQYCEVSDFSGEINYVASGAAAFAEFYDLNVTSVSITVDLPEGQERVGISEIRILGK